MSSAEDSSSPMLPSESRGSSVSSALQDEYNELLKYAVITPHFDPSTLPKTLAEAAAFPITSKMGDPFTYRDTTESETGDNASTSQPEDGKQSVMAQRGSSLSSQEVEDSEASKGGMKSVPHHRSPLAQETPERPLSVPGMFETPTSSEKSSIVVETPESSMQSPVVDPDIARMASQLDNWCMELKRNVLAEFSQSKIALIERHRKEINVIKDRHNKEMDQLYNELGNLKELIHTYEQSVERKDQVITNLTRAVQKQKERFEMLKRFESWKLRHSEDKREAFTSSLAKNHHKKRLMNKVWSAWHSIIEAKWRQRVEKACQAKAQEVCMKLTNDYEARVSSLNEALESSRAEVAKLHAERDHYEETMKKAFMRGVCALNMEAMTMFHDGEDISQPEKSLPPSHKPQSSSMTSHAPSGMPSSISDERNLQDEYRSSTGKIVTSQGALTSATVTQTHTGRNISVQQSSQLKSTNSVQRSSGSTLKTRVTASQGSRGVAPPMSSVVVERHHPVTKQTVGHATASKYPISQHPAQSQQGIHIRHGVPADSRAPREPPRKPQNAAGLQPVKVVH